MNFINKNFSRILLTFVFTFTFAFTAYADKWVIMTFNDDIVNGLQELEKYCVTHDVKVEDVMWANNTSIENLKPGTKIYLPKNQIDLIGIWQHIGSWNNQIVPDKKIANSNTQTKLPDPKATKLEQAPKPKATDLTLNLNKPSFSMSDLELKNTHKIENKPDTKLTQTIENLNQNHDAIIAEKPKNKDEIPGLMDPIIILSPNGDPTTGPMRLIISGDKVEVVRLPKSAAPKRPSIADLDHTFGTSPAYLPSYPPSNNYKPKNNNFVFTGVNPNLNLQALNGKMLWPVNGRVTSGFGPRGKRRHTGLDIPMPLNTPIRAARNGIVARTGNNSTMGFRGYGNFILLDHGGGVKTLYAHCSSVSVREGQKIMQGQIVGLVGRTGRATTEHLHFEVRINDKPVNPVPYLATNPRLASYK